MKPDDDYPLPVRYVLYTHYMEGNDFEYYRDGKPPCDLAGVQFLVTHLSNLSGLLTWPGYEGLLVLFYAPGLNDCLASITNHQSIDDLKTCKEIEFAEAVRDYLSSIMNREYKDLLPRLRFFTALDLHKVFGRVKHSNFADRLKTWMVGDTKKGLTYDSPKIIEAIVRLRLLGSGVPVFRVDHDVLFRGHENCDKKNLEFSSTVGSCLTAYQLRRDSPNLSSFIFSASYDHKVLHDPRASHNFNSWGRAYATRVYPSLPFNETLIMATLETIKKKNKDAEEARVEDLKAEKRRIQADAWDSYAVDTFRPQLARKFFGFGAEGFAPSQVSGLAQIGANPLASVISGAMLYLSDGAILDLPPFSNFSLNVSWIDDHLKYCLHRELRHLRSPTLNDEARALKQSNLLRYSKLDDVIVQKAGRKIQQDLRVYIFDVYLPTLLRGTILDAWITPDPLLKYRLQELTPEKQDAQSELNDAQSEGLLPSALQNALAECNLRHDAKVQLKIDLEECALKRITQVRRQWAALTENEVETFASIWANGRARKCCPGLKLKYSGLVNDPTLSVDVELTMDELSNRITSDLNRLIEDACNYIDWTRDWPTIVQVVRSIEQGTLRTDLNLDPEQAGASR